MNRSLKKGPFIKFNLIKKNQILKCKKFKLILKTWSRTSTILPVMVKTTFAIYNGKSHIPIYCKTNMIGYKLGEFALTKKFIKHTSKQEKKIKHL